MDNITQYVQITRDKSKFPKGLIYPVREHLINENEWVILGTTQVISKEDCEPYVFPTPVETTQDIEELAKDKAEEYEKSTCSFLEGRHIAAAERKGFIAGFKQAFQERKAGYTITEDQIRHLSVTLREADLHYLANTLVEWFPTAKVFIPEPTYKVGNMFNREGFEFIYEIIRVKDNEIALFVGGRSACFGGKVLEVKNREQITDQELKELMQGHYKEFTLMN